MPPVRPNPALSQRRPGKSRLKSCNECVQAKAKCNRERPACSRCRVRGTDCEYGPRHENHETPRDTEGQSVGTISLRWLAAMTQENSTPPRSKMLSQTTIYYCCRFLRTFPLQLAECPPFVHPTLRHQRALANATTLMNMVQVRAPGSESLVSQTVLSEMGAIMSSVSASWNPLTTVQNQRRAGCPCRIPGVPPSDDARLLPPSQLQGHGHNRDSAQHPVVG